MIEVGDKQGYKVMDNYCEIIKNLISKKTEQEWFEFKENWNDSHGIGEYISALSNAAAVCGHEHGYLIWGVNNETHEVVGTSFDYRLEVKGEPLEHYLARQLKPDITFSFFEVSFDNKKVVVLEIPAAKSIPTSFDGIRYARIGSSKVNLNRYPDREVNLFKILSENENTIENMASEYQDLTFDRLFTYYAGKGVSLKLETFKKNLGLLTKDGKYNLMAQLLSDDSHIPIRVSLFMGETKASPLYSVKEFGNTCILLSLDKVLEYADVINIIQADESRRMTTRKEVALFDATAFREAVINAFVHNKWVDGNAPMITVFNNRVEILSRGALDAKQTKDGFYRGESIPVNKKLSDIFLQLHISERSGRGVPTILEVYGKDVFDFRENAIAVNIPFNWINKIERSNNCKEKEGDFLSQRRKQILREIISNPHITQKQLSSIVGIGLTAIENNIRYLKENKYIERIGSNKTGYWEVKEC